MTGPRTGQGAAQEAAEGTGLHRLLGPGLRHLGRGLRRGLRRLPLGPRLAEVWRRHVPYLGAQVGEAPPPFAPPGHYYSPLPDLSEVRARRRELFDLSPRPLPGVDLNEAAQEALLGQLSAYAAELPFGDRPGDGGRARYGFRNDFFSYSDGYFLYAMLRHLSPRRYLEVGSGHSSALALDVNERFLGGRMEATFIEPDPRRLRSLLRPGERVRLVERPLSAADPALFAELGGGDVLFVDSTHVSKVGSDVNQLLFQVLPRLRAGVYVHFHDILYPFEYPEEWIYEGRAWNEAYLLRAFLQYNSAFEVVLFPNYLIARDRGWFAAHLPLCLKNPGGSLWLRRR